MSTRPKRLDAQEVNSDPDERRAGERSRASFPVKLIAEGTVQRGLLHDRSKGGLCVYRVTAEEGARVTVQIADEEHVGTVRWAHGHRVGIAFDTAPTEPNDAG